MVFKNSIRTRQQMNIVSTTMHTVSNTENAHNTGELSREEQRRQMYARIAEGNALADVEENARQLWHG